MRNRNTVEFLGLWESINNPDFKQLKSLKASKDLSHQLIESPNLKGSN